MSLRMELDMLIKVWTNGIVSKTVILKYFRGSWNQLFYWVVDVFTGSSPPPRVLWENYPITEPKGIFPFSHNLSSSSLPSTCFFCSPYLPFSTSDSFYICVVLCLVVSTTIRWLNSPLWFQDDFGPISDAVAIPSSLRESQPLYMSLASLSQSPTSAFLPVRTANASTSTSISTRHTGWKCVCVCIFYIWNLHSTFLVSLPLRRQLHYLCYIPSGCPL